MLVVFALVARACRLLSVSESVASSCWCASGGAAGRMVGVGAERRHRARWGPGRTRGVSATRPLERLLGFWVPRRCRIHPPRRLLQLFALEPAGVALGSRLPPPGVDGGGQIGARSVCAGQFVVECGRVEQVEL